MLRMSFAIVMLLSLVSVPFIAEGEDMLSKVFSVEKVEYRMSKSHPPQLVVKATGTTNSAGWTDLKLIPATYVDQPADGIQDFDFVGKPPSGMAAQVMEEGKEGLGTMEMPAWVKGVRVHASSGEPVVKMFAGSSVK